jgi:serine/threonine protein kinase
MAPEVISSTHYDNKCDIFSFGIIMYQTLTQVSDNEIYPTDLNGKKIDFLLSNDRNFRPIINEKLKNNEQYKEYIGMFIFIKFNFILKNFFLELMIKCWDFEPRSRPDFNEISKILESILVK